jgi:endonuclease I
VVSRSIVTTASNAARRAADSQASIRAVTVANPVATAAYCGSVIRWANPAAVVELNPGTGVSA